MIVTSTSWHKRRPLLLSNFVLTYRTSISYQDLSNNMDLTIFVLTCITLLIYAYRSGFFTDPTEPVTVSDPDTICPVSVNYHFSRKCNMVCGFCFHTEKSSHVSDLPAIKKALRLLKDSGMRKINFAGGEPFLYPALLATLVEYCKVELGLESVSVISNGTKINEKWLVKNAEYIDVLGVSCDSFDEEINIEIGRGTGRNVEQLFRIAEWCKDLGIIFKLNTVVNAYNWEEDMVSTVERLAPNRWKVFQVLVVEGENTASAEETANDKRKRDAKRFVITDEQFEHFCEKHKHLDCFVPEPNNVMKSSYLILDEYLCFLDKGDGVETQSKPILDVGVQQALKEIHWDQDAFQVRGGVYDWSKEGARGGHDAEKMKALEW